MDITAENLENAEAAHPPMLRGAEVTGKREEADAPRFWMLDV